MKLFRSRDVIAVLGIIAFSFFAIKPLFAPGFFSMHDNTQIARVFTMAEALKDMQFPVRVVDYLGYGYGYTIFNFYAPFPYYVGSLFVLFGVSPVIATKIMIGLGMIAAGVFMYLLAKEFWGKIGGVIAGILYVYAPYHSVNLYVRGAISELWAYAFIPLTIFGFYKLYTALRKENSTTTQKSTIWKYSAIASIGYAGIILSHNLTAMMVTPFLLLLMVVFSFQLFRKKHLFAIPYLLYAALLGLGLSSFYFLPALMEMKYTDVGSILGGGSDFRDHFLCPIQFWYSPWGYGGSVPGCLDGLSFQLGKVHILFVMALIPLLPLIFTKKRKLFYVVGFSFVCLAGVLFLMTSWSRFIWEIFSPMEYFQFPWRFLVLASFFMSFLAGGLITVGELSIFKKLFEKNLSIVILGACLVAVLGFYGKFFVPQFIVDNPEEQANPDTVRFEISKISDEYLPPHIPQPQSMRDVPRDKILVLKGLATFSEVTSTSREVTAQAKVNTPTTILFQKAYFPAWTLFIDGKKTSYNVENGKIKINLSKGTHSLRLSFLQTPIEILGNLISIISLLVLLTGIISSRKRMYL